MHRLPYSLNIDKMTSFVIFGANGLLGRSLVAGLRNQGHTVVPIVRDDLDIFDFNALYNLVHKYDDSTLINCIAHMPADKCELEPLISQKVNVDFVESLVKVMSGNPKQRLIQFSSDFVFDGENTKPYLENSSPNPLNVYGSHKHEAEKIVVEKLDGQGQIIRFASLISHSIERKTFLEKVIDRALKTGKAGVVGDLTISTATSDLIQTAVLLSPKIDSKILHAVHGGETSWFEIAQCAFSTLEIDVPIEKLKSNEFITPAKRPRYSVLSPTPEIFQSDSRAWDEAVRQYVLANFKLDER